ncbi:hypothetical protein TWF594_010248 [Orbilia oligospora]|uniref:O-fucosyltransferase family protein n=1 Tax=Orbilia oligospora TaxID=2813651 RepID=A0A7C8P1A0_ORBOL|nr:hypothetical protein TWF706_003739 [Orbilia oligospora]KAF3130724.1 hypothetical protein TWF594_010248 [Orbilia oligospora]KAF3140668.1 hypothetical protein TWF703_002874 [Orbilia oligospora]
MFTTVLGSIQSKAPRRPVHSLVLWTGLTFFLVAASTYFLSQTRPAVDYFTHRQEEPAAANRTNPLLTKEGIDQFVLDHAYPRLGESVNFTGLHQLCNSTKWQPNVYFACNHNAGGLMNVRNMVLNCIRYAIAAGVSGLVMPQMEVRDPVDLRHLRTGEYQSIGFLFDEPWLKEVMKENCGQMEVFDTIDDIPYSGYAMMPDLLNIQAIMEQPRGTKHGMLRNKKPWEFRSRFDKLIKSQKKRPTETSPVIVRLDDRTLFSFPPSFDPPSVLNSLGFTLDFRPDLSALANVIIDRVHKTLNASGNDPYIGLHLRSEPDAGKYWATWDQLANATISTAMNNEIKLVYVASGDTDGVANLTGKAAESGIKILDKWNVLSDDEKEYLGPFRFDQQAIVDYLALLRSDRFVGSGQSSFSSQLLLRRELLANLTLTEEEKLAEPDNASRDQLAGPGRLGYWDMDWP